MTTGLADFFTYNLWANLRLLDACAYLSDAQLDATTKGTFGSVRETLMHLFAAEEGYAQALTGTSLNVSSGYVKPPLEWGVAPRERAFWVDGSRQSTLRPG